jgi:hypothetical protein
MTPRHYVTELWVDLSGLCAPPYTVTLAGTVESSRCLSVHTAELSLSLSLSLSPPPSLLSCQRGWTGCAPSRSLLNGREAAGRFSSPLQSVRACPAEQSAIPQYHNINNNNTYTFPVRALGVYLDHLELVNSYCPDFPMFAH